MAVYTKISPTELSSFLSAFDIGTATSLTEIAEGIENTNYFLNATQGRFILTIFEKRVNSAELPYFLDLMDWLSSHGFSCPLPVKASDGNALRDLCGKKACLTTFLNGKSVPEILPPHCAQLGTAIAKMQAAAEGFAGFRPNDLSVSGWAKLIDKIGPRADEVEPGLYDEIRRDFDSIAARWPTDLPQCVIHADLFPDNVFFTGDTLSGVIDYYFSCNDMAVYETAICLNAWCFDKGEWAFNVEKGGALLTAYNAACPLSAAEKDAFPVLAHGASLRFLLTRTYDWLNPVKDSLVTLKNPKEYIAKLRFHRTVSSIKDYGLPL